eukprot:g4303.t1
MAAVRGQTTGVEGHKNLGIGMNRQLSGAHVGSVDDGDDYGSEEAEISCRKSVALVPCGLSFPIDPRSRHASAREWVNVAMTTKEEPVNIFRLCGGVRYLADLCRVVAKDLHESSSDYGFYASVPGEVRWKHVARNMQEGTSDSRWTPGFCRAAWQFTTLHAGRGLDRSD